MHRLKQSLLKADPAPDAVITAAREALANRIPGAELAELVFDSVLDDEGSRGGEDDARVLLFLGHDVAVLVRAVQTDDHTHLTAKAVSGTEFELLLRMPGGLAVAFARGMADEFRHERVRRGSVSLVLTGETPVGRRTIVTDPVVV